MTGDDHRRMRVPRGRACVIGFGLSDGRLQHQSRNVNGPMLAAPARCGSAHRGLLMEANRELGAGQTNENPARRVAHNHEQRHGNQSTMTDERALRSVRGEPRPT